MTDIVLHTARLALRPARDSDAARFVEILTNWNVIRMLPLAPHPYALAAAREWIASHVVEQGLGTAFRFVIEHDWRMIGTCDVDEIDDFSGALGYWLEKDTWGRGFATEAAAAVVEFAFMRLGLLCLTSGHASDNPGSGRVLAKLGFRNVGQARIWSMPRNGEIDQIRYEMARAEWRRPTPARSLSCV